MYRMMERIYTFLSFNSIQLNVIVALPVETHFLSVALLFAIYTVVDKLPICLLKWSVVTVHSALYVAPSTLPYYHPSSPLHPLLQWDKEIEKLRSGNKTLVCQKFQSWALPESNNVSEELPHCGKVLFVGSLGYSKEFFL